MSDFHRSAEWAALVRKVKPIIQADIDNGLGYCLDCAGPIHPGDRWQVGHRLPQSTHPQFRLAEWNVGPSHGPRPGRKACNQSAGAKHGNKMRADRKTRSEGFINWRKS